MNEIKIIDLHTHTKNSPDGNHEALFMAETARDNKIHTVAFTDHCEVDYYYKDNYDKVVEGSYKDVSAVCEKLQPNHRFGFCNKEWQANQQEQYLA